MWGWVGGGEGAQLVGLASASAAWLEAVLRLLAQERGCFSGAAGAPPEPGAEVPAPPDARPPEVPHAAP